MGFALRKLLLPVLCASILAPVAAQADTITVWWNKGYYPEEDAAIKDTVHKWEQKTGNKVQLTFYSTEDLPTKLIAAVNAGSVPDVAYEDVGDFAQIPQLAWDGRLTDLTDVVGPAKDLFTKTALLTAYLYDNKAQKRSYYAVPIKQQAMHVFYWKSMLAKAGKTEKDIPQQWGPYWKFWEQVQDTLRSKGERVYSMGLPVSATGTDNYYLFNQFLLSYGVRIVDEHGNLKVDDPNVRQRAIDLITFLADVYKKGYIPPGAINWGDSDNNSAFYAHQIVMTFNASLSIPAGKQNDPKTYHDIVTMQPPVGLDGKPTPSLVAVKSAIVPGGAKHAALAKDFLKFLIQPKELGAYLHASQGRWLPVMPSIIKADPFWTNPNDPHLPVATKQEVLEPTEPWPQALNPAYAFVNSQQVWGRAVGQVLVNGVKPDAAVDQAIAQIKKIFSKYQVHE
jgi:multiple sugar transport system substrate-binding protein